MAKKILVVDDIPFVRETISEILRSAHYLIVGEASDGLEAIEKYFKLKPDLVTMDVVMPKMSGVEATRKIVKQDRAARIVIVSAMGQENLIMEAIAAGAKDYILKPFTADDILKTVQHLLAGVADESETKRAGS